MNQTTRMVPKASNPEPSETEDDTSLVDFSSTRSESSDDLGIGGGSRTKIRSAMQERMLDTFPLSDMELDWLLQCYNNNNKTTHYGNNENDEEDGRGDDGGKKNSSSKTTMMAVWLSTLLIDAMNVENSSTIITPTQREHIEHVQEVEHAILPESPRLLQQALSAAFVVGAPIISNTTDDDEDKYDPEEWKFLEAMSSLLGRRGSQGLLRILYNVVVVDNIDTMQDDDTCTNEKQQQPSSSSSLSDRLLDMIHRLIWAAYYLQYPSNDNKKILLESSGGGGGAPKAWKQSLTEHITKFGGATLLSLPIWLDWATTIAPQVYQALPTYIHYAFFTPYHSFRTSCPPLGLPTIVDHHQQQQQDDGSCCSALWKYPFQSVPTSLALLSPHLGGGRWHRLYSSDLDGFSFPTFQQALLDYHGPTVILTQTTVGDVFGYYTNCPWKNSSNAHCWYGGEETDSESFLFGIKPTLQLYSPEEGSGLGGKGKPYYMYLHNPLGTNTRRPGVLTGLAVGGINDSTPRLHIPLEMERCKAGSVDSVYQCGPLLSNEELYFDIDILEVWAVTSSEVQHQECLQVGQLQASIREGNRIKAAQVDRKQFLEDFQSGQYTNSLFTHRDQVRGRHSFIADDDGKGYFIQDKSPSTKEDMGS